MRIIGRIILIFGGIIALLWVSAIIMVVYNSIQLSIYGADVYSTASTNVSSGPKNITVYVPVMLDGNGEIMKMYESPNIIGNLTASVIDSEYGKALKVSGTGGQIEIKEARSHVKNNSTFNFSISMSTLQNKLGQRFDLNRNTIDTAITIDEKKRQWDFNISTWVYSDNEIEDFSFSFKRFGSSSSLELKMQNDTQKLIVGWQVVNLTSRVILWDY